MTNEKAEIFDRDKILELLSESIGKLKNKIDNGRIKDEKKEKLKIEQYRALIYSCNTYNSVLKDKQLDDLDNQLTELKTLLINQQYNNEATTEEIEEVEEIIKELKI